MLGPVGLINRHDGHWFESHNLALFFGGSLDLVQVARRATAIRRARRFTASRPKIAEYAFGAHRECRLRKRMESLVHQSAHELVFRLEAGYLFQGAHFAPRSADGKFYLMVIDTTCPSLSNRVGKVPDSA